MAVSQVQENAKLPGGLVGVDGNAHVLLGKFRQDARRAGWDPASVTAVLSDAMSGDYNHLLHILMNQYEDPLGPAREG